MSMPEMKQCHRGLRGRLPAPATRRAWGTSSRPSIDTECPQGAGCSPRPGLDPRSQPTRSMPRAEGGVTVAPDLAGLNLDPAAHPSARSRLHRLSHAARAPGSRAGPVARSGPRMGHLGTSFAHGGSSLLSRASSAGFIEAVGVSVSPKATEPECLPAGLPRRFVPSAGCGDQSRWSGVCLIAVRAQAGRR